MKRNKPVKPEPEILGLGSQSRTNALVYLLLLPVMLLPLFLHLGKLPIQLWDESRLAINAIEMSGSSNWLVTTFYGEPDLWNTKPPLMIWLQAALMRLIGFNEWAVRLPSALAGLATVALVFWFGKTQLKSPGIGILSALVLVTSRGYINPMLPAQATTMPF